MKSIKLLCLLVSIAGLALLVGACSAPASPVHETAPATAVPVEETVPAPTTPVQVTEPASDEPSGSRFSYEGLSFVPDPALAESASGQVLPENPGSPGGPYWEPVPQVVSVSLDGYPVEPSLLGPVIAVYPVEDYRRLNPQAGETLDSLEDFLAFRPAEAAQIPSLPVINAGQVFHSNLEFLDFQDGSGVRFLTAYSQAADPLTNRDLVYTFQGLTGDGRYAVSVFLPVSHPSLPADPDALSSAEIDAIYADFGGYISETAGALSNQPADTFTPNLEDLDALVASLAIE